ncbi:MAG: SEC-C domain-containing protein [Acidobacteria bacterium]|nr:SEC-C domain-containing protein [Acidobacteriota bacterium]
MSLHASAKIGRNDPCPCGSSKKYKHCCPAMPHRSTRCGRGNMKSRTA